MNLELLSAYLNNLAENNNREWFHAHKAEYQQAKTQFEELVEALKLEIGAFEEAVLPFSPKELTFKLNRDTRFSHDKSPYNPAFRAHISSAGKLPIPVGYYLSIRPKNQSFLGGGLFADSFQEATRRVREEIAAHGGEWEELLYSPAFRQHLTLQGTVLKNLPAGYDREHPQAEFLKYKSWYLVYPISDAQLIESGAFLREAADIFRLMKPFNDFLNRALAGFQMPAR